MYSCYGQMLAHNHCLLQMIGIAKFVGLLDLDEFAIPKVINGSLKNSLLKSLESKAKKHLGGFQVRSSFVNVSFASPIPLTNASSAFHLPDIFSPMQLHEITPEGYRCKMFLRPEGVLRMTVHQPFTYADGFREYVYDPEEMVIYHLRNKGLNHKLINVNRTPFLPMKESLEKSVNTVIKALQSKH